MRAPTAIPTAVALAPLLSLVALTALAACSGTSAGNIFTPLPDEAGPPIATAEAGSFFNNHDAGGPAQTAECDPVPVTTQPAWQPPEAWKQDVCTAAQISGFYDACLTPPISSKTCQAFVQQNGTCAPCLQSQDTDPTGAAVVWHEQMQYWTVNVAGCIAQATGDASATGCGASYAAAIACRQSSCNACWVAQGTSATFQQFSDCETLSGSTTCQTYAKAVPSKCGDLDKPPASACMPNSGATAQQAFMQIAPLFCGQ